MLFFIELLTFDNAASDFQRCHNYDGSLSQFGSQQIQKSKSAHQFCSVLALTVTNKCEARRKYLTPAIHSGMPSAPPPLPCTHLFCGIPHCNCTFYFIEKSASYFCHRKMGRDRKFAWVSPSMQFVCPSTSTRIIHLWTYRAPIAPVTTSECDHFRM